MSTTSAKLTCSETTHLWVTWPGPCLCGKIRESASVSNDDAKDAEIARLKEQLAEARKDAMCDVCAGTGKVAAPEGCVCGGTGKAADALVQMREMYLEARKDGEDGERLETLYRMLQAEDWLSDDALMDVLFAESQGRDFRAALDAARKGAQDA